MYNNNLQIVQTPTAVMIDIEMNHDARIINIADKSGFGMRPDAVRAWFGDSIGHWEGDTFVVVTKNFSMNHQKMGAFPVSGDGQAGPPQYACHEGNYAMPGILRADAEGHDTAIESEGE
jgi:hypothetical protein